MGRIKLLDESTINKIAAGEVIERPMSVVKELVENSLDAKAKNIIIKLKEGGKKQISVIDDGIGMEKEDLLLCVKKHATSKIEKIEDIFSIYSYGFRGEALATIAEVSKLEIISATENQEIANKIVLEDGKIKNIQEETYRKGTTINVYNLFYTVPARQKFLKSPGYELKKIMDWVKSIAVSNPDVSFKVYADNKLIFNALPKTNYGERIKEVFGLELIKNDYSDPVVSAIVYFSKPNEVKDLGLTKQIFYLNKRPIKNETINKAIYKAYQSKIPKGKKPNVFVFLEINPKIVDVNVHPQKLEVRVKNENLFYFPVYEAISKKLEQGISFEEDYKPELKNKIVSLLGKNLEKKEILSKKPLKTEKVQNLQEQTRLTVKNIKKPETKEELKFKIIGQLFNTYILVEMPEKFMIIDQHVAEERYYYEKFYDIFLKNKKITAQKLLVPISLNFEPEQVNMLLEKKSEIEKMGFDIEEFGKETVVLRQIPLIINKIPAKEELKEMLLSFISESSFDEKLDHIIATMACKTSVKGDTFLTEPIMRDIVKRLFETKNPYTCPHGRPVIIEFTKKEIEKKIGRI